MINVICFLFPSVVSALRGEGYQNAIKDILVFKDKIYTGPVTLLSDDANISNCTFLGNEYGLKIEPYKQRTPDGSPTP